MTATSSAVAQAAPREPSAIRSPNVRWLGALRERDGVSVAFAGRHMFLSTLRGLAVYDVSKPATPAKVGELPLPGFHNEDVSTNGEILLISHDSVFGQARLHVVDVRERSRPRLLSSLDTTDFSAPWEPVGHTASCLKRCRYAWLAGRTDGIDVVDLRNPRRPRFAKRRRVPLRAAACGRPRRGMRCFGTHDVQVDSSGLAWVAGAGGTAAYDIRNPVRPRLRFRTDARARSRWRGRDRRAPAGTALNDFLHHNSTRRGRTVFITEEDLREDCRGAGSLQSWRIGRGRVMRPLDSWRVEVDRARGYYCSAHFFHLRARMIVQGWFEGGARFIDVTRPRRLRQAGYWIPRRGKVVSAYWPPADRAGEIAYALDEQRGVDILRFDRDARPARAHPPSQRPRSGLAEEPEVGMTVSNGRTRVRPRTRVRYRLRFRNTSGRYAGPARVVVRLGRGLRRASNGRRRATVRMPRLAPGATAGRSIAVRVRHHPPSAVDVAALLFLDDADPTTDFAVDRDPTRRIRTARMSAGGPFGDLRARPSRARATRLCMLG